MEVPIEYIYLAIASMFAFAWALLFSFQESTRKIQLRASIGGTVAGPISELYFFRDYWLPESVFSIPIAGFPLMIEDVLFGFFFVGVSVVASLGILRRVNFSTSPVSRRVRTRYLIVTLVALTTLFVFVGLNSIYAASASFVGIALFLISQNRKLAIPALVNGATFAAIVFVLYLPIFNAVSNIELILSKIWFLHNTALDARLLGVPASELVFAFSWGVLAGAWVWYRYPTQSKPLE